MFQSTPRSIASDNRTSTCRSQDTGRGWPLTWYHPFRLAVFTQNFMPVDTSSDWTTVAGSATFSTATWVNASDGLATPIQYSRLLSRMFRTKYIRRVVPRSPNVKSGIINRLSCGQIRPDGDNCRSRYIPPPLVTTNNDLRSNTTAYLGPPYWTERDDEMRSFWFSTMVSSLRRVRNRLRFRVRKYIYNDRYKRRPENNTVVR